LGNEATVRIDTKAFGGTGSKVGDHGRERDKGQVSSIVA
jgi:hypothetical protein